MHKLHHRHRSRTSRTIAALAVLSPALVSRADEPIGLLEAFSGNQDFFATGAPMAIDGPDADTTRVDMLNQPASVEVTALDVPADAQVRAAYLYWGGSIGNSECGAPGLIDDTVDFTPPGEALTPVIADACYCSEAGAMSYDVQLCRTDVTNLVGDMIGMYTVDGFDALISNGTTHNASFSIVLVYSDDALPPRRIGLYDGFQTMSSSVNAMETITLAGLDVDDPAVGDLTWYVLEGDVGGGGGESVSVTASPGGGAQVLTDALNPTDNPMNHTINTTAPVQVDAIGVDIDQFPIDGALAPNDVALDVTYTAGGDKWWIAYNIVGVNVFEPVLASLSSKDWVLSDDADADGLPSPGDTLRYTIHLENSGNTDGIVAVEDEISPHAASWSVVSAAGGVDESTPGTLVVTSIPLAVGASADVVLDLVIAEVDDGTLIENVATFNAEPGSVSNAVLAPPAVVSNPGVATGTSGASTSEGGTGGTDDAADGDTAAVTDSDGSGGDADSGGGAGSGTPASTGAEPVTSGASDAMSETGAPSDATGGADDSGGCACSAGRGRTGPAAAWVWLLLGGLAARRRTALSS